ncbi:MAG: gamma-glutamyl-gamma-aminobutyrate hydrolase family protein [Candidatus Eremiobacteraeota bacterium]|nr:gamma-glutamyl-gamma-aminobutyrate hydrolase family protein [Candidatus Eremiobacteraeota bacterium]
MKGLARVGITSSRAYDASGAVDARVIPYARAVRRFGGEPILLANELAEMDALLSGLDAVLVTGGVDVDPAAYGGRVPHARSEAGEYVPERDAFEAALVVATRERGVPTLGICRGLQIANVAFGGTLIEDVREEYGDERYVIEHRQTHETGLDRTEHAPHHEVALARESRLAALLGTTAVPANSMHHQAVRATGDGLAVVGRTSDGPVEAAEATFPHPFFFAVQWHPEELLEDAATAALFGGLVRAGLERR